MNPTKRHTAGPAEVVAFIFDYPFMDVDALMLQSPIVSQNEREIVNIDIVTVVEDDCLIRMVIPLANLGKYLDYLCRCLRSLYKCPLLDLYRWTQEPTDGEFIVNQYYPTTFGILIIDHKEWLVISDEPDDDERYH